MTKKPTKQTRLLEDDIYRVRIEAAKRKLSMLGMMTEIVGEFFKKKVVKRPEGVDSPTA